MNYFNFKNIDSRNISGLIVQELPPITKPPMRVSLIEIDGRDGDLIEELGYQAYDKVINIGLTRSYDINEIISWLNGDGELILSNENDKYYKAKIIEQIDFERLARFKTANIKFHVQPYKYKTNENYVSVNQTIQNIGNIESKPLIRLEKTNSNNVSITINGTNIQYDFNNETYVEIDCEDKTIKYNGLNRNRQMIIGYNFPKLSIGVNTISFNSGTCTIKVKRKDRWL